MQPDRYWQAKKVTLIGALMNTLLGFVKLVGGILFSSHALIADGFHSFADLITDLMVTIASKYGSQDADDSHPYGHQRIETAATLLLSLLLIMTGMGIAWDSLIEIIHKIQDVPTKLALPIAALSILINEALFHYTKYIGNRINSNLIIANAWHHRSDAATSIVVFIGIGGSLAGFSYLDAIAAIVVGFMIIHMGLSYGWNSVKELVDTAVNPHMISKIQDTILQIDGVQKIHQLRSRLMGQDVFIDVHILVSPYLSVSEGHFIAQHVHVALMERFEQIKDVTVHVDPEDDETAYPSLQLPTRSTLEEELLLSLRDDYREIQYWVLHYLEGKVTIDLICDPNIEISAGLQHRIQKEISKQIKIGRIRIFIQQQDFHVENPAQLL